jgi:hypothetical protein
LSDEWSKTASVNAKQISRRSLKSERKLAHFLHAERDLRQTQRQSYYWNQTAKAMTRANPNPPVPNANAADPDAEFLDAVEQGGDAAAPVGNAQGGNANGEDESEDEEVEVDEDLCKCF